MIEFFQKLLAKIIVWLERYKVAQMERELTSVDISKLDLNALPDYGKAPPLDEDSIAETDAFLTGIQSEENPGREYHDGDWQAADPDETGSVPNVESTSRQTPGVYIQ